MKTMKVASDCICLVAMVDFLPDTAPIFDAANPYPAHLPGLHLIAPMEGPTAPRNCHLMSKCGIEISPLISSEVKLVSAHILVECQQGSDIICILYRGWTNDVRPSCGAGNLFHSKRPVTGKAFTCNWVTQKENHCLKGGWMMAWLPYVHTRSLTSIWSPFGSLGFNFQALQALKPCDPRRWVLIIMMGWPPPPTCQTCCMPVFLQIFLFLCFEMN